MFTPRLFTSKPQFFSARDQFARWYESEFKGDIKTSAVNQKFANFLGCKDFNTALGQLEASLSLTAEQKKMIENAERLASKEVHLPMAMNEMPMSIKVVSPEESAPTTHALRNDKIVRSITRAYTKTPIGMATGIRAHRNDMYNNTHSVNCEIHLHDLSEVTPFDCRDYLYHLYYYGQLEKEVLALLDVEGCKRQSLESLAEYYEDAGNGNQSLKPLAWGVFSAKKTMLHERSNQCGFTVNLENSELIKWIAKIDDEVFYSVLTKLAKKGHDLTNHLRITIECSHGSNKTLHRTKAQWREDWEGDLIGHTVSVEIHSLDANKTFHLDGDTWRHLDQHDSGIEVYTLALFEFGITEEDVIFALEN